MHAKYVLDAEVEVGETMLVESEITHSVVRCRGAVEVPRGRIVSGDVTALGGVTVGVAGGEGLSRTVISAGLDHRWDAEVEAREEEARGHEHNRTRIQSTVRPLLEREKSLTPQQREAATELLARAAEMETTIAELKRVRGAVRRRLARPRRAARARAAARPRGHRVRAAGGASGHRRRAGGAVPRPLRAGPGDGVARASVTPAARAKRPGARKAGPGPRRAGRRRSARVVTGGPAEANGE